MAKKQDISMTECHKLLEAARLMTGNEQFAEIYARMVYMHELLQLTQVVIDPYPMRIENESQVYSVLERRKRTAELIEKIAEYE